MNLFDYTVPDRDESFDTLLEHKNIKVVRIVSSDNIDDKEYCQEEDEWVVVLEGSTVLEMNDEEFSLKRGDYIFIPSETKHKVLSAKKGTLWLALHIY